MHALSRQKAILVMVVRTVAVVAILTLPLRAWGANSPLAMIRATVQKTLAVLQDPAYQGAAHRQERLAKVEAVILPHFDTVGLAQHALGLYWHHLTVAEQQQFVQLFTSLIERAYGAAIDRYARDVQVSYGREHIEDGYAEVDTRVLVPSQDQVLPINYFLHQVNGQWLIYDVQIDNVSMVLNYRSQFSRILRTSSYAELVQRLKTKLQELNASPS